MAVINDVTASLTGFTVNGASSNFVNNVGDYGTYDVLNGGELLDNTLAYSFRVVGLKDHRIASIVINAILLNDDGSLCTSRRITTTITGFGNSVNQEFQVSDARKVIVPVTIENRLELEETNFNFDVVVSMNTAQSCYYAMTSVVINLDDIPESVVLTFGGPATSRSANSITISPLIKVQGTEAVTFSKDPTQSFDVELDNVEGRVYFRKEGIYVDGYQYGTVAPATNNSAGIVKLFNAFEIDPVDGGIIAPNTPDSAATPQLVYNAMASLKQFSEELVNGVTAPDIYIEEEGTIVDEETGEETPGIVERHLDEKVTFSDDFEATEENKIYIKWLEIA